MADPHLFAPWFRDRATWAAWLVFLKALFKLPLIGADLAIYQQHTGRRIAPANAASEAWLIVGRRGGKSRILALIAVFLATFKDWSAHLSPGERGVVMILASDRRQARVIFGYVRSLLSDVALLAPMVEREGQEFIELKNGIAIEIHASNFRSVRGYTLVAALLDELAFWPTDDSANPDTEILNALRPAMATVPGAMLLAASSPYARRGALYAAHRRHYGKDGDPVLVWQAPTRAMNPTVPQSIIDAAMEEDPSAAAAEWLGEFRADVESFITREVIDAATVPDRFELPRVEGVEYAAFVDPSGGSADSMTLGIAHREGDKGVLDALREVRPPFSPEGVVEDFAALLRGYGVGAVRGDRYSGEWVREQFRQRGIRYEVSERSKSDIYREALPLLNSGKAELLDHPRLAAQLGGLERRTARGGKDSIDHRPGSHDDLANAACGALVLAAAAPALIRAADLLREDRPVPLPRFAQAVFATLIVGGDGRAAIAYFAAHELPGADELAPLTLVDVTVEPLSASTVPAMFARLEALARAIPKALMRTAFVPRAYLEHVQLAGYDADEIPAEMLRDLPALALVAAGHVNAGRFRIAAAAAEKARALPLASALTLRAGEGLDDDPLRLAILVGIGLGLSPAATFAPAARVSA